MTVQGFFIGLILISLGTLGLKFNYQISNSLGTFSSVEQLFGPGRQYSFYKLLGVLFIIIGFFVMFGFFNGLMSFLFSPVKNALSK